MDNIYKMLEILWISNQLFVVNHKSVDRFFLLSKAFSSSSDAISFFIARRIYHLKNFIDAVTENKSKFYSSMKKSQKYSTTSQNRVSLFNKHKSLYHHFSLLFFPDMIFTFHFHSIFWISGDEIENWRKMHNVI